MWIRKYKSGFEINRTHLSRQLPETDINRIYCDYKLTLSNLIRRVAL
jgi:hypothetical protein